MDALQLNQQQLASDRLGCKTSGLARSLKELADSIDSPAIGSTASPEGIAGALHRIESRQVFGKVFVTL